MCEHPLDVLVRLKINVSDHKDLIDLVQSLYHPAMKMEHSGNCSILEENGILILSKIKKIASYQTEIYHEYTSIMNLIEARKLPLVTTVNPENKKRYRITSTSSFARLDGGRQFHKAYLF